MTAPPDAAGVQTAPDDVESVRRDGGLVAVEAAATAEAPMGTATHPAAGVPRYTHQQIVR